MPQIIKLPNNLAKGNVNACMARHIDLAPTVLRLLGIPAPDSMGGQSLLAVDGTFLNEDIECAFSETDYRGNCLKSVRTINKKFIHVAKDPRGRFDPVECYDLSVDPCETTNRAGSGDLGQRILQDRLDQFSTLAAGRTAIPGSAEEISAELIEQLKSLGYVR